MWQEGTGRIAQICMLLQDQASAFILDLRDNSGGVVGSGYNIAQLFLKDGDGFCIVRIGTGEEEVVNMQDTSHVITQPTVSPLLSLAAVGIAASGDAMSRTPLFYPSVCPLSSVP